MSQINVGPDYPRRDNGAGRIIALVVGLLVVAALIWFLMGNRNTVPSAPAAGNGAAISTPASNVAATRAGGVSNTGAAGAGAGAGNTNTGQTTGAPGIATTTAGSGVGSGSSTTQATGTAGSASKP